MRVFMMTVLALLWSIGCVQHINASVMQGFSSCKMFEDGYARLTSIRFHPEAHPKLEYDIFFNYPPCDYINFQSVEMSEKEKAAIRKRNHVMKLMREKICNSIWTMIKNGARSAKDKAQGILEKMGKMIAQMFSTVVAWISPIVIVIKST